jgi:hypothetical protein
VKDYTEYVTVVGTISHTGWPTSVAMTVKVTSDDPWCVSLAFHQPAPHSFVEWSWARETFAEALDPRRMNQVVGAPGGGGDIRSILRQDGQGAEWLSLMLSSPEDGDSVCQFPAEHLRTFMQQMDGKVPYGDGTKQSDAALDRALAALMDGMDS